MSDLATRPFTVPEIVLPPDLSDVLAAVSRLYDLTAANIRRLDEVAAGLDRLRAEVAVVTEVVVGGLDDLPGRAAFMAMAERIGALTKELRAAIDGG